MDGYSKVRWKKGHSNKNQQENWDFNEGSKNWLL